MINHHIDKAISLVEAHQGYIDLIEDILNWHEEDNSPFSEDECEYNQNGSKGRGINDDFFTYSMDELRYHKQQLEKSKVRLRICMLTFNQGWTF